MNYSVLAGGKTSAPDSDGRELPAVWWELCNCGAFMAALEMIHNYSLVHDDLPAMDNDEYRRGRKTTWNVYGGGHGGAGRGCAVK